MPEKNPYLQKLEKEAAEGQVQAHFWIRYAPAVIGILILPMATGIEPPFWLPFTYLALLEIFYFSANERRLAFSFSFFLPWLWYYFQFDHDGLGRYTQTLLPAAVLALAGLAWRIRRTIVRFRHGLHAANDESPH